ncbi:hypothetical protein BaRGS_00027072, partial [Batillaria attramentaria]
MEWSSVKRMLVSAGSVTTLFLVASIFTSVIGSEEKGDTSSNETERYQLVVWDFHHVEVPYVICLWILLASVAKIGFHLYDRLSSFFPESCLLILLGIAMGALLHYTHTASTSQYVLNANTFFLFLLPPIIYDAGYHMPLRAFFNNLGTILLLAVVNTLWNTIAIGISLWAMSYIGWIGRKISLLHCFMFSALISAVDPVAVLAVFEDVHVNEMLYIIVFGESLLNDGVTVVLYHMMEGFAEIGESNIEPVDYAAGVGSFFIIALGGTLIGMIYGMVGGFITKYTDHVRVIEPLFVFVLGYLAYLTSEMMHLSGILALSFGGITMRHYVEANMNEKSVTAVKYTMKMMANVSETVIFMFLGLSTVVDTLDWQWDFIFFALIFCIIYRVVDIVREKNMFVTTTIIVVFFTVFVQGITIKPVVNALKVKRQGEKDPSMNEMLHERLIDHLMAGMEDIVGRTSHNSIKNRFEHFNIKVLKPLLLREKPQTRETSILNVFSRLNVRDAMHHITSHGAFLGRVMSRESSSPKGLETKNSSVSVAESNGDVYFAPPGTVLDIQSVEAVYSKRDADDTYMHHLLEDAMFPPRKAFTMEKKHTVDENTPTAPVSHHALQQHLRRLISIDQQHKMAQQNHLHTTTPHTATLHDTAVTTDETKVPLKDEDAVEPETPREEDEVVFSLGPSRLDSQLHSGDSGMSEADDEPPSTPPPEETEAERVLPWKRTTQLPPVPSAVSLSMPDDDHPLMSQAPSWADNLAYNHLTESGSPYVSPENTINAGQKAESRRPVFDIFPPTPDVASPGSDTSPAKDKEEAIHDPIPPPWASHSTLPPPWVAESSEEPVASPEAHNEAIGNGEKVSTYLQSSSHNFYPPSHHNCIVTQDNTPEEAPASGASVRLSSPKHFQPIQVQEMCSRHGIEVEIISDEAGYQEGVVSRVQQWLDSSEPSECEEENDEETGNAQPQDDTDDDIDDFDIDEAHLNT